MSENRKKYNCIIEELDSEQLKILQEKISSASGLQPWLAKFVERFHTLGKEQSKSKIDICNSVITDGEHLDKSFKLSQTVLSENTNPTSEKFRCPNANTLIALSISFGVSIDYLTGITDCMHPKYEKAAHITGLSENALRSLELKHKLSKEPNYSKKHGYLPSTEDGSLDVVNLESSLKSAPTFSYTTHQGTEIVEPLEKIIEKINQYIEDYPEIFDSKTMKILNDDSETTIENKMNTFQKHCPVKHFFETINMLITYKDGLLIKCLSEYLFPDEIQINKIFVASSREEYNCESETLFNDKKLYQNLQSETLYLTQIQSELVKMHEFYMKEKTTT